MSTVLRDEDSSSKVLRNREGLKQIFVCMGWFPDWGFDPAYCDLPFEDGGLIGSRKHEAKT